MAITPAPRARRAVNVEATAPTVPVYETEARRFVRANKAKNKATKEEKEAVTACNRAMAAANVRTFEFEEDGKTYDAVIAAGTSDAINIDRLYKMVTDGKITMPQFLKCCSATQAAVKKELGTNMLNSVIDTKPKAEALTIKPRK